MPSKRRVLQSSMVVGSMSLLGSLTGILVETSIAAKLGLSRSSDTFYVAFTVPYIIVNLLSATGQFSLVPFFSRLDAQDSKEELWRGFSYAVNVLFLGMGLLAAVGAATSPFVIRLIAPGLTRPQIQLATELGQWLFLIIIPAGIVEVFRSFLFSQHYFALPSGAGFLRNATVIAVILAGFNHYGSYSIVLGYMAGYLLQFLVLGMRVLITFRPRYSFTLVAGGEAFRSLHVAGGAQLGGAMAFQGVYIVERIIASFLPPGTLTALNYGFKILGTMAELLAGSVGTATFPALSRAAAHGAEDDGRNTFKHALEISLVLTSPTVVFCLLLDHHIIRLIFERGNFTPGATGLMALVFFYYMFALLPFSFIRLLTFALFARHELGSFLRVSAFQYGLTVCFDLIYVGVLHLGAKGIPLGLLTASLLASAQAFRWNLSDIHGVLDRALGVFAVKNLVGAFAAAGAVVGLGFLVHEPRTGLDNFVYLCELCGAGTVAYFAVLGALGAIPLGQFAQLWQRADES